jgi:hypothetical protein
MNKRRNIITTGVNSMKNILLAVLLFPLCALSQVMPVIVKETDPHKDEINKDITRLLISLSTDTKLTFTASYEREVARPLTLVLKAGPGIDRQYDSIDAYGQKQYNWVINAVASAELRCYIGLRKRARQHKTVRNFSAFYFSAALLAKSAALIRISNPGSGRTSGYTRPYVNIGYQKQFKKTYYNIFFGTRFPGKVYDNAVSGFDLLHAGVSVGKVF